MVEKKDVWLRMIDANFPSDIVEQISKEKVACPDFIHEKLEKAKVLHKEVHDGAVILGRVLLLLGPDSPMKDLFMGGMAVHFIEHGFKPRYVTPEEMRTADYTYPACYALCLAGVSYINAKDWIAKKTGESLRNHLAKGRVLILSAETMGDVETAFGTPFVNYISTFGVEIDFPSTRPEMPKL